MDSNDLVIGAFTLATALAWNEAVKESLNELYPLEKKRATSYILYAIIVTILAIIIVFSVENSDKLINNTYDYMHKAKEKMTLRYST